MKPISKDWDEFCYPFIYEDNPTCDFEIATDDLCCRVGLLLTMDIECVTRDILERMQPNVYHLNGSVRGKIAIHESHIDELKTDYHHLRDQLDGGFKGFVLPGGSNTSAELHLARCQAKKTVRALVAIEHHGKRSPAPILFRYANLLANTLYALAAYENKEKAVEEREFVSASYGKQKAN